MFQLALLEVMKNLTGSSDFRDQISLYLRCIWEWLSMSHTAMKVEETLWPVRSWSSKSPSWSDSHPWKGCWKSIMVPRWRESRHGPCMYSQITYNIHQPNHIKTSSFNPLGFHGIVSWAIREQKIVNSEIMSLWQTSIVKKKKSQYTII